jgi:basic membrane lipoprotein Med (substrate-binding protein (PBP1-ABC) superfamily)
MNRFIFIFIMTLMSPFSLSAPLKVGFIYVSPVGNAGWTYSHDLGREYLEKIYGDKIQTKIIKSVPEGIQSRAPLAELARDHDIIFATSWGYMIPAQRTAKQFPNVKIEHVNGLRRGDNLSTYANRSYEARYLSGIVAAAMSTTGQLGYVAAYPLAEVIRGLNAFTLGAQTINPDIIVNVEWINAWYAPDESRAKSHKLIDQGVDVLAQHVNTPVPVQVAEERGVFAIGYHTDMSEFGPKSHLVSVIHDWGKVYASRIEALQNNNWKAENLWLGLKDGISKLDSMSTAIPQWAFEKVELAKSEIISGKRHVFSGPIKNHRGRIRVKAGHELSDEELQRINWYAEGIRGDLRFF